MNDEMGIENFHNLMDHADWRLERKDPPMIHHKDLRMLSHKEQNAVIEWYAVLPLRELRRRQDLADAQIKRVHRQGHSEGGGLAMSNLQIMRTQLDQAVMKQQFGEGWSIPGWALPSGDLDEFDGAVDRGEPLDPDEQQDVWAKYGMKKTPGFSSGWELPAKSLSEVKFKHKKSKSKIQRSKAKVAFKVSAAKAVKDKSDQAARYEATVNAVDYTMSGDFEGGALPGRWGSKGANVPPDLTTEYLPGADSKLEWFLFFDVIDHVVDRLKSKGKLTVPEHFVIETIRDLSHAGFVRPFKYREPEGDTDYGDAKSGVYVALTRKWLTRGAVTKFIATKTEVEGEFSTIDLLAEQGYPEPPWEDHALKGMDAASGQSRPVTKTDIAEIRRLGRGVIDTITFEHHRGQPYIEIESETIRLDDDDELLNRARRFTAKLGQAGFIASQASYTYNDMDNTALVYMAIEHRRSGPHQQGSSFIKIHHQKRGQHIVRGRHGRGL